MSVTTANDYVGLSAHDHRQCKRTAIENAVRYCERHDLRLTPVRRRVLEILLERHEALGAYEVLDRLREEGLGSKPPIAYRALQFLVDNGFAHRIEKLNAFVACAHPGTPHNPAFMLCKTCHGVAESVLRVSKGSLGKMADEQGFHIENTVMESEGLCATCIEGDQLESPDHQ